jgi:galactokinase
MQKGGFDMKSVCARSLVVILSIRLANPSWSASPLPRAVHNIEFEYEALALSRAASEGNISGNGADGIVSSAAPIIAREIANGLAIKSSKVESPISDENPDQKRINNLLALFRNQFSEEPEVLTKAPGRNTGIGDHQDYPGPLPQDGSAHGYTLAWASNKNVLVAGRKRTDGLIRLVSANNQNETFEFNLEDLDDWANHAAKGWYVPSWAKNVMAILYSARNGNVGIRDPLRLDGGADILIEGNVPMGAGQSSSAAFMVATTLAFNELFNWNISVDDKNNYFELADIARAGEHMDYSPFISQGKCGYLDQITSLAAVKGKAVLIDHGNYRDFRLVDLSNIEKKGWRAAVLLSGLSRNLAQTDYPIRVKELEQALELINRLLGRNYVNIHQVGYEEWLKVAEGVRKINSDLADRVSYLFEENERTLRFVRAVEKGDIEEAARLVSISGYAMSMKGRFKISGTNTKNGVEETFEALDALCYTVLSAATLSASNLGLTAHFGTPIGVRMIGGGGAGPLFLLLRDEIFGDPSFVDEILAVWKAESGFDAVLTLDPPAAGAAVMWKQPPPKVVVGEGDSRIEEFETYDLGKSYRLINHGTTVTMHPEHGNGVSSMKVMVGGHEKELLYYPADPGQGGASPVLLPWANRISDGIIHWGNKFLKLQDEKYFTPDGNGHGLHGLVRHAPWRILETGQDEDGVFIKAAIRSDEFAKTDPVKDFFGPSESIVTYRLKDGALITDIDFQNNSDHDIPITVAVHPWFNRDEDTLLQLSASSILNTHPDMIPVESNPIVEIPAKKDFSMAMPVERVSLDTYYKGVAKDEGGWHSATLTFAGTATTPRFALKISGSAGLPDMVVYNASGIAYKDPFVCLEPSRGGIDALNQRGLDPAVTPPGGHFHEQVRIEVTVPRLDFMPIRAPTRSDVATLTAA